MATLDDINNTQIQGVKNLGLILQALKSVFVTFTGKATSAATGSATALPANPAGYTIITFPDGSTGKVPFYN